MIIYLSVGKHRKKDPHTSGNHFRISNEGHIIPTRPSVMGPIDLPFRGDQVELNVQSEDLSGTEMFSTMH